MTAPAVRIAPRSVLALAVASVAGLMMLCWPLLLRVPDGTRVDPPFLFVLLLPVVIAVVLAELSEGGLDSRVLAILGVLSAINAILRGISPGLAGVELTFFLLVLAGRVFGPGLRVRARLHVAVRLRAADRRGRAVDAVPDALRGLGRHGRRAAAAPGHRPRRDRDAGRRTPCSRRTPSGC